MGDKSTRKRRRKLRRRRVRRIIIMLMIFVVALYLALLMTSLYGQDGFSSDLRNITIINVSADYAEENLGLGRTIVVVDEGETAEDGITIIIKEDVIYYIDDVITIEELESIIVDNADDKVILVDDNAKRVTYSAVYDRLDKLGVIIDEK